MGNDNRQLQRMQDRLCFVGNVFGCCFDEKLTKITELSGSPADLKLLANYADETVFRSIAERVLESSVEDLLLEDTAYPWLKMAAIDISSANGESLVWAFAAVVIDADASFGRDQFGMEEIVISDEKGPILPVETEPFNRREIPAFSAITDGAHFDRFLTLVGSVYTKLVGNDNFRRTAQSEQERSRVRLQEASERADRIEAMTQLIQLLDSEDSTDSILRCFTEMSGKFLNCSYVKIFQFRGNTETPVAKWYAPEETPDDLQYSTADVMIHNWKLPTVIGSGSRVDETTEIYMEQRDIRALAALPVYLNGALGMAICFAQKREDRIWTLEEIRYMNDGAKILSTVLTKRINQHSLATSYSALEGVLDNVGCGIYVMDPVNGEMLFVNKYCKNTFPTELAEGCLDAVFGKKRDGLKDNGSYEFEYVDRSRWFDFYYMTIIWMNGRKAMLCSLYDITDKKMYQKKIEQQAYTDFLTGLYNRLCSERDLAKYVDIAKTTGTKGSLLYLDLDNFKHINDGLGHQYGDVLLQAIARSIQKIPGIENTCYRMGGDEFVIIIPPENFHMRQEVISGISAIFNKPWFLKDAEYYCTMSMGVVNFPDDGDRVDDLIKKADISMYDAKKGGKNQIAMYNTDSDSISSKRLDMEKNMRAATLDGCREFDIYFQPVIDVSREGNPCCGAEALVRWNSSELGFVSPGDFIPLAEYLGLINPIGDHVLMKACRYCREWNDKGHPFKVNVNLSVVQLLQHDIIETIEHAIKSSGINPHNLTLEVTESLAINDMYRMKRILGEIKQLGVRLALDDFGTGYSSLGHIRELPFDVIKMDQSFVRDLAKDSYSRAFVKTIAELAQTIGVSVCVEGIETKEQFDVLAGMNIKMVQGYFFDRPLRIEDFEKKYLK